MRLSKAERHAFRQDVRDATHMQSWLSVLNLRKMHRQQARVMLAEAHKRGWRLSVPHAAYYPPLMQEALRNEHRAQV